MAISQTDLNKMEHVTIVDLKKLPKTNALALTASQPANTETIPGSKTWSSDTLLMTNLPTSDPSVAGQLWNDSGILKVSAG